MPESSQKPARASAYKAKQDIKPHIGGPVRVSSLNSPSRLRAEVGRLYREARHREGKYPDSLTALRLSQILGQVAGLMELEIMEAIQQRIEEVAARASGRVYEVQIADRKAIGSD